ncbi:MAG: hypothetical protein LC104_10970 [Bacteroidales bacterium]|nr:hypothetical protein [Bacteroidales bacterium]
MRLSLMTLLLSVTLGCGGGTTDDTPDTVQTRLTDLKFLLEHVQAKKQQPPKALKDLLPYEPEYPGGYQCLALEECVYIWGAKLDASGTAIIAYEKATPTSGGAVLLQNGSVQKMTAEEFSAAPKANRK